MKKTQYNSKIQYGSSIGLVLLLSLLCYTGTAFIGYKVVAYILLLAVSLLAMLFDIKPVLFAAILSALIWNFFFIPPTFTLHISNTEDSFLFLMYFVIALLSAVLSSKIKKAESKARDKAEKEKTIKLYNTLLNSLSHELRTPIATIIGAIDTLKDNDIQLSNDNKESLLHQIDRASIRLNGQVENLLNMSRLESGFLQLKKDWSDINELIYLTISKLENDTNHDIIFEENPTFPLFKIDAGILGQAIFNLLHNAITHTVEGAKITLSTAYTDTHLIIVIEDSGSGFPEESIEFVFDKFYRLPNSKTGGTGLGLSIVKGFIEAHGGEIFLENSKTSGAKFTISIPAEVSHLAKLKNE